MWQLSTKSDDLSSGSVGNGGQFVPEETEKKLTDKIIKEVSPQHYIIKKGLFLFGDSFGDVKLFQTIISPISVP